MTLADFCTLEYVEFLHVLNAYLTRRDSVYKDGWERTRMLMTTFVQPYLKPGAKITPHDILPLPWDNADNKTTGHHERTREEQNRRTEELMEKMKKLERNGR